MKAVITHHQVLNCGGHRSGSALYQKDHIVRPLSEYDVTVFDFAKERNDSSHRPRNGVISWGDTTPSRKLIRHAKGVGINLALKRVLEGQPPSR